MDIPDLKDIFIYDTGSGHICVVHGKEKKLKCWGANPSGQSDPPEILGNVFKISLGFQHSCVING